MTGSLQVGSTPQAFKRVVVLGAGGFVGGAVKETLQQHELDVTGIGRAQIDLLDEHSSSSLAEALQGADAVVAAFAVAPCKTTAMLVDNLRMVKSFCEALTLSPVPLVVNISSDAVYPDLPVPIMERVPPSPGSLHGAMHLAREIAISSLDNQAAAHIRPTLIFGGRDPHNGYGPNQFMRAALSCDPIRLFGDGSERRDHIYIGDVAELVHRVITHNGQGVLNAATGVTYSFGDCAAIASKISGNSVEITSVPRSGPPPHNGFRPFDVSLCSNLFAGFTFTSLEEGLMRDKGLYAESVRVSR